MSRFLEDQCFRNSAPSALSVQASLHTVLTAARNCAGPNHFARRLALLVMRCMMMRRLGWLAPHSCVAPAIQTATDTPRVSSQHWIASAYVSHPSHVSWIAHADISTDWIQYAAHVISGIHYTAPGIAWISSQITGIDGPHIPRISRIAGVHSARVAAWISRVYPIRSRTACTTSTAATATATPVIVFLSSCQSNINIDM